MPTLVEHGPSYANPVPFIGLSWTSGGFNDVGASDLCSSQVVEVEGSRTKTGPGKGATPTIRIHRMTENEVSHRRILLLTRYLRAYRRCTFEQSIDTSRAGMIDRTDERLGPAVRRIANLARLQPDWDSYGGHPPTPLARGKALEFLRRVSTLLWPVAGERARPASISPLPSGGIELEWQGPSSLIAVDVGPDGTWGYLRKRGSGESAEYQEDAGLGEDKLLPLVAEVLAAQP